MRVVGALVLLLMRGMVEDKSISIFIHHDEEIVVGDEPYDLQPYIDVDIMRYEEPDQFFDETDYDIIDVDEDDIFDKTVLENFYSHNHHYVHNTHNHHNNKINEYHNTDGIVNILNNHYLDLVTSNHYDTQFLSDDHMNFEKNNNIYDRNTSDASFDTSQTLSKGDGRHLDDGSSFRHELKNSSINEENDEDLEDYYEEYMRDELENDAVEESNDDNNDDQAYDDDDDDDGDRPDDKSYDHDIDGKGHNTEQIADRIYNSLIWRTLGELILGSKSGEEIRSRRDNSNDNGILHESNAVNDRNYRDKIHNSRISGNKRLNIMDMSETDKNVNSDGEQFDVEQQYKNILKDRRKHLKDQNKERKVSWNNLKDGESYIHLDDNQTPDVSIENDYKSILDIKQKLTGDHDVIPDKHDNIYHNFKETSKDLYTRRKQNSVVEDLQKLQGDDNLLDVNDHVQDIQELQGNQNSFDLEDHKNLHKKQNSFEVEEGTQNREKLYGKHNSLGVEEHVQDHKELHRKQNSFDVGDLHDHQDLHGKQNSHVEEGVHNLEKLHEQPNSLDGEKDLQNIKELQGKQNSLEQETLKDLRNRRQAGWDVNKMADNTWKKSWTRPPTHEERKKAYYKRILVIKEQDLKEARAKKLREITIYIGSTLSAVLLFLVFVYFLIRYPDYFICGCCVSRCIIAVCCPTLGRFLESPEKFIQERLNDYVPGITVHEDGHITHYPPSEDEIGALQNVIDVISDSM